ncbi:toll/interleukin-1 receptor domain-containing protein [Pectobacterium carotovorum]|uniref:toll/interleukin-1 receptor domain-containing protein n=1 Tax=Pectobacterium carotovorum TaxID=554 RepID=UPI0010FD3361|nr:toll/interleukin-1 receptor domain-containing protein [Pectobacterium carotovorum]KAA3667207.1 toll/interleukin-1 receptor domain-containing protein [Pectobacterium carotovorum subsp. carotovorum]
MSISIFLSHNHSDKDFVRKLARDLENHGVRYWLDEAEMKIGDSLIMKIREGIDNVDYFAIILSPNSINAPWVVNELDVAMNQQISGKKIKVLPIMFKECEAPGFLLGKFYGDFRHEENYEESFKKLINSIGIVFNKNIMRNEKTSHNLSTALDKALYKNLPMMCKPFHRPFQYIGMTISQVEKETGCKSNDVGNIIVENEDCHMLLEAEGNFINYVEVDFKKTAPHYQNQEFDSEIPLGALSIGLSEIELARKETHYHTYYDHRKKLKISVSCPYDGAPLTVGFSSKYYGM